MEDGTRNLIEECRRQEESCLCTSTSLFEWLKRLRLFKAIFVVVPIILGGVATWPLLAHEEGFKWLTGVCALGAGLFPALYKALDFDVSVDEVAKHAHQYKSLQDRFRQAWRVTALGPFGDFKREFDTLVTRMDTARSSSLTPPERFFRKAKKKIDAGHYDFAVDASSVKSTGVVAEQLRGDAA